MSNVRRINVRDDDGELVGWFDADAVQRFAEDEYFDGSNYISLATGSEWEHEELYRTAGGRWVVGRWSQWQDAGPPHFRFVGDDEAGRWLLLHSHDGAYRRLIGVLPAEGLVPIAT